MADERVEQTAEIEHIFSDFGKAFKAKDYFIDRGMGELQGVINNHLQTENLFQYKEAKKLTESGSEIVSEEQKAEQVDEGDEQN